MQTFKGYFIFALCIFLFQVTAEGIETPFVLNANKVPVLGGTLNIFGLNFGDDPSLIRVYIIDTNTGRTIPCIDVDIVLSNAIISCDVVDIGTGKEKRIEVNVNGKSNAFTEDTNMLFSRFEPIMSTLGFSKESSSIQISGHNFGVDTSLVSVLIDGYEHTVISVNDSTIVCAKHADYVVPNTNDAEASSVSVIVDGLHNVANLTFVDIANQPLVDDGKGMGGLGGIDLPGNDDNNNAMSGSKLIIYIVALVSGGVGVVLIVLGFLIMRKRKLSQLKAALDKVEQQKAQPQGGAAIIMERADSMEEVDLGNNNNTLISPRNSFYEPSTRDENESDDDSSSSSSFSSPYSSTNASPFASPFASSPEVGRRADDRSPATLDTRLPRSHSHSSKKSKIDYDNVHTPNSRLSKRSLDSPYFTKQSAFDSPLHTSAELSAVNTPNSLASSQEITAEHQPGASVFDTPSVLHTAIARAAMLRGQPSEAQQQIQQQQLQQQQQIAQQQRRASLGAFQQHPFGRRRSSLGISSLHVSALHSSFGMQKQQIMQQQPKQQRPLSMSQGIEKPIAE